MADAQLATFVPEAAPEPSTSDFVASMTADQRQEWKATGKLPEPAVPEESAPSTSETSQPEAETQTESETVKPQEKPPEKMSGAEKRIKQLLARTKELESQLATRSTATETKQAEKVAEPAPAVSVAPSARPKPTPTDLDAQGNPRFNTYEDFTEDLADWKAEQRVESALKAYQDKIVREQKTAEITRQNQEIEKTWQHRVDEATKKHSDFKDVALAQEFLSKIPKGSVMDAFALESESGPEILYHLASHADDLERIVSLAPLAQARELFRLEIMLSGETTTPAPKTTSSAPPPPAELAARGLPPVDEAAAALQRGDFAAYRNAANARELSSRKG